jgi:hypothetical protein
MPSTVARYHDGPVIPSFEGDATGLHPQSHTLYYDYFSLFL